MSLRWNAVEHAAAYEYAFKTKDTGEWSEARSVARPEISVENLQPNTSYTFSVTAVPEKDSELYLPSEPALTEAATAPVVPQPLETPVPRITSITHVAIGVGWEPVADAASYLWEWKKTGDADYGEPAETPDTEILLENLSPETGYTVRVRALPAAGSPYGLPSEAAEVEAVTQPAPAVDLNAGGAYANCYMVGTENETYRFDAKVRGNGTSAPSETARPLDPKDAFVVWESSDRTGGVIASCTLSDDGFVTFTVTEGTGGNALIAVTDGNPVEGLSRGEILWSWHIWSTERPDDVVFTNHDGQPYTLMSRNLGACSETPGDERTNGLRYQWGRKDPFIGFAAGGAPLYGSTAEEDYAWEMQPAQSERSVELATAYPTVFFSGSYASDNDWYYGGGTGAENRDNSLWGNPEGNGAAAVKTVYDPCPAGYRVAPAEAFTGFTATGQTAVKQSEMNVTGEYDDGWNMAGENGTSAFFPSAGYLVFSSGVLYSAGGYNGAGFYVTSTPDGTGVRFVRIERSMIMYGSSQRAAGNSVRCVKE